MLLVVNAATELLHLQRLIDAATKFRWNQTTDWQFSLFSQLPSLERCWTAGHRTAITTAAFDIDKDLMTWCAPVSLGMLNNDSSIDGVYVDRIKAKDSEGGLTGALLLDILFRDD